MTQPIFTSEAACRHVVLRWVYLKVILLKGRALPFSKSKNTNAVRTGSAPVGFKNFPKHFKCRHRFSSTAGRIHMTLRAIACQRPIPYTSSLPRAMVGCSLTHSLRSKTRRCGEASSRLSSNWQPMGCRRSKVQVQGWHKYELGGGIDAFFWQNDQQKKFSDGEMAFVRCPPPRFIGPVFHLEIAGRKSHPRREKRCRFPRIISDGQPALRGLARRLARKNTL